MMAVEMTVIDGIRYRIEDAPATETKPEPEPERKPATEPVRKTAPRKPRAGK